MRWAVTVRLVYLALVAVAVFGCSESEPDTAVLEALTIKVERDPDVLETIEALQPVHDLVLECPQHDLEMACTCSRECDLHDVKHCLVETVMFPNP